MKKSLIIIIVILILILGAHSYMQKSGQKGNGTWFGSEQQDPPPSNETFRIDDPEKAYPMMP